MHVFMSAEVLGALAGTLFPKPASSSQDSSGASTPADEVIILLISVSHFFFIDYAGYRLGIVSEEARNNSM